MEGGFFLNVIVGQGASIFKLFASKNQTLLIRGDTYIRIIMLLPLTVNKQSKPINHPRLLCANINININIYIYIYIYNSK